MKKQKGHFGGTNAIGEYNHKTGRLTLFRKTKAKEAKEIADFVQSAMEHRRRARNSQRKNSN